MQHAEFRRLFGANPRRTEPELLEHRATCADCARYARDLERLDQLVAGALQVPAPAAGAKPWEIDTRPASQPRSLPWYALAASLLVATGAGSAWWLHVERQTLFGELLKHANAERNVMVASSQLVSEDKVRTTLAKAGARLQSVIPVSTARTCKVRGVVAPHLFVQTEDGPVQLLLLTEHRFLLRHATHQQGLHGELVPVGAHAVAVFADNEAAVARGRELARAAIQWTP